MLLNRILHRIYSAMHRFGAWRHRHITPAGTLAMIAAALSGFAGFNIFKSQLYQLFAMGSILLSVSLIWSLFRFRIRVDVRRILPDYASAGTPVFYEIELINRSSRDQKGLVLYEETADPRPSLNDLLTRKEPYEDTRNAWDRKTLYYRWVWLVRTERKAVFTPVRLPVLPAGEAVRVRVETTPFQRGVIHFTGVTLARPDIFSLFHRLCRFKRSDRLPVLPKRYPVGDPDLVSSRHYHPGGIELASSIGNSTEFMALRPYRPGDPLRHVHWRSYARTRQLVVKEFEDEYFVRHALILDTCLTRPNDDLFEAAVSIAASYIHPMQTHESILDLLFVGSRIYTFPTGRGLSRSDKILEILAGVRPCPERPVGNLIPALEKNISRFSGSVCIFLDWLEGHREICRTFSRAGLPVLVIILTSDPGATEQQIAADPVPGPDYRTLDITDIERGLAS